MSTTPLSDPALERTARRNAAIRMGWLVHALAFAFVNVLLWSIDLAYGGPRWAHFPTLGWGLGVLVHGFVVWLVTGGGGLHQRLLQAERQRLAGAQKDPW